MFSKVMFDLDQLRVVEAIARQGSFTAAAKVLHRVPSTISYAVGKLEEDLGVGLFLREGRSVRLTAEGEELLRQGRYLLQIAEDAQRAVRQVSTGWEPELRIAISDVLSRDVILALIEEFQQVAPDTRVRLTTEVLAGAWDALHAGRADLVIGAGGDAPLSSGIMTRELGEVEFVFAISPDHPLAQIQEPLSGDQIRPYPVIAVADTSRDLPVRTADILLGQTIITLPDMHYKLQAHRQGIGVGSVPMHMIKQDLQEGRLVVRETAEGGHRVMFLYAWRSRQPGLGLNWFIDRLTSSDSIDWFN
jgi:DNA-binding transcriptional LysR family regulator